MSVQEQQRRPSLRGGWLLLGLTVLLPLEAQERSAPPLLENTLHHAMQQNVLLSQAKVDARRTDIERRLLELMACGRNLELWKGQAC